MRRERRVERGGLPCVCPYALDADAEHFLQVKEESKRTIRGTEIEGETILGDYKEVGGMMFPHSVDSGQKGNPQRQKIVVEKIEVNVPIDDARFKMPESK